MPRSEDKKAEIAIGRLKREAAKLGANAIVLQDVENSTDGTAVGASVQNVAFTHNGDISLDLGTSTWLSAELAHGEAIYIPVSPGSQPTN